MSPLDESIARIRANLGFSIRGVDLNRTVFTITIDRYFFFAIFTDNDFTIMNFFCIDGDLFAGPFISDGDGIFILVNRNKFDIGAVHGRKFRSR